MDYALTALLSHLIIQITVQTIFSNPQAYQLQ